MKRNKRKWRWEDLPLARKVLLEVGLMSCILFAMNMMMYWQLNKTMQRLDRVYVSNVSLTELSESLEAVQLGMYSYLTVKTSDSLDDYYRSEQAYRELLEKLNEQVIDNPVKLLEKNIRKMSETYLQKTGETVTAKRGRNVEKYNKSYDSTTQLYRYINSYLYDLNSQQFKNNSSSYQTLSKVLQYLETVSSVLLIVIMGSCIVLLFFMVREMVAPLTTLAAAANLVGKGNFHVMLPPRDSQDEVGVVTRAFNTMVASLEEYMTLTRESMEKEQQMMERELLMKTHLKEAELKFLQSQINPHFLFNSLNAGAQLAMMEDAEKTCIFVERMADFFRYNVKKGSQDSTLLEELEAVENYIYILNVRFAGDIHFQQEVDERVLNCRMPSMILQPIVENAVNHGVRNIEWQGEILLKVTKEEGVACVRIRDNGKGISREEIDRILSGEQKTEEEQSDSTGVGMYNVISRLELYYNTKNLVEILSQGENMGTEVIICLPMEEKETEDVSNFISR